MNVEFGDSKLISSMNVDAKVGSFALDKSPLEFEFCRERFAKVFDDKIQGFYFKTESGKCADVANFLLKTEDILQQKKFSNFSKTNRDSILWVEPSEFWQSCEMRRSLLTILLRCALTYSFKYDNYQEALFDHEYIIPTKKAMMRFLFGFTKYTGDSIASDSPTIQFRGWKSVFEGKEIQEIKKLLISNDESNVLISEFSKELWA